MRTLLYLVLFCVITSCGIGKKSTISSKERRISVAAADQERRGDASPTTISSTPKTETRRNTVADSKADDVINTALTFSGVRYKFGGTTSKGMDCSGLLFVSFGAHDLPLPRTSYHMAEEGKKIRLGEVTKGDLLFFKTNKRSKRINHVGMVVEVSGDEIRFIHASTSRGVTVSSLREGYWNSAFVQATRVL